MMMMTDGQTDDGHQRLMPHNGGTSAGSQAAPSKRRLTLAPPSESSLHFLISDSVLSYGAVAAL